MLQIKNLKFWYKDTSEIFFENLDFEITLGDIVWVYGWSGNWKTTFLKILWWLLKPNEWKVIYNWESIFDSSVDDIFNYRSCKVWFAFQDFRLLEDFSVYDNIMMPFNIWNCKFDKDWIDYIVKYFEIFDILNNDVSFISWWEKERVSIVKSFAHKPEVILLDEPGTYLDEKLKNKLFSFIYNYSKEAICVFTSHDNELKDYLGLVNQKSHKNLIFYNKWLKNS